MLISLCRLQLPQPNGRKILLTNEENALYTFTFSKCPQATFYCLFAGICLEKFKNRTEQSGSKRSRNTQLDVIE